ncbi:hypothetical protein AMS68_002080 [Peltaster fructicola]|uniref:L-dopachrome isomerase n=1 Tax=Peltaster fructicola TaxID=286661 RepID=A0A6H0XPB9_9PEZI|nr:hypothetical protein AMS68_002080 [Peltaster fructicola]
MPHSTTDLPNKSKMTSIASHTSARLNGGPSSTSLDNKWKRASLPASDTHGELGARGRSGSIISTASTAVVHRKSHYYDSVHNTRDKVVRESPLIAELRTNVIIKDEYTLVTDLSYHLATRYSKPDASIMINIDHSSCLALAGTFDPCYILTITTIPSHMSAALNKRNASLIQTFMADILSVPSDRGIIKFVAIPEDNYAMHGSTIAAEIERVEKDDGVKRSLTDGRRGAPNFKNSMTELDQRSKADARGEKERRAERRRSTATTSNEIFELAAEKPAQTFAAENGLRMNGISKEELTGSNARLANGRPKTIAGHSLSPASASVESMPLKSKHISTIAKPDQQKAAHMPKPDRLDTKPSRQQSTGAKSQRSPVTPVTLKETIVDNPKVLKAIDTDTTANTAKRRSTISATPRMPAPPPVPESKTPKVSKRKSFLAAFRR